MIEAPETRFARTPGGQIAYQVLGDGPFDIAYVSELMQNIDVMWEHAGTSTYMRGLAALGRLICFDKRGHGVSDNPSGRHPMSPEEWVDDLRSVLDAADSKRAVIVGDGAAGGVAIMFAATYPERVRALVLQNSWARYLRADDYPWGLPSDLLPRFLATFDRTLGTGETLRVLAPSQADDEAFRRWWGRYERLCARPTAVVEGFGAFLLRTDVRAALESIQVPTLILHRSDNKFVPVAHGRYLAEHIEGSTYRELPGDSHLFQAAGYDELLAEIGEFLTGVREAPDTDRMLATVMFTDIVDSTGRTAEMGDGRWRETLEAHNALVRGQLARFRGREVNTTGDGFVATFDGPARAIRCARAIAAEVRQLGIEIRAGLHTGECERLGADVGGIAVDIAARVTSLARPGEVLVSSTVKDLVAGSGIQFDDRGAQKLKGVPGTWHLHAATA